MSTWLLNCGIILALVALLFLAIALVGRFGARGCGLLLGGLAVLGLAAGWWHGRRQSRLREMALAFASAVPELEARAPARADDPAATPCLRGKLLLLENHAPHALQLRLPERLRASRPAEVETLGMLACEEVTVGVYRRPLQSGRGQDALQHVCQLDLLDLGGGRRFARTTLRGSEPPHSPGMLDVTAGSFPDDEIVAHLAALPPCAPIAPQAATTEPAAEPAADGTHPPAVVELSVAESTPGGKVLRFRATDSDGDLDLRAEHRVFVHVNCGLTTSTTTTSASTWNPGSGSATVSIPTADIDFAGTCKLLLTVRDEAGNGSPPAEIDLRLP